MFRSSLAIATLSLVVLLLAAPVTAYNGGGGTSENTVPELLNPSVSPASGDNSTVFVFSVTYLDKENQQPFPKPPEIIIDSNTFAMSEKDTSDGFVGDGKEYNFSTMLSVGNHTFSFKASDGTDNVSTSDFQLQVISTIQVLPSLRISISSVESLDANENPKTAFTPGETLIVATIIENTVTSSESLLVSIQVLDAELTALPPTFIKLTLEVGQKFTFSPSVVLPADAMTGTWEAESAVFSDFPSKGGISLAQPKKIAFDVI